MSNLKSIHLSFPIPCGKAGMTLARLIGAWTIKVSGLCSGVVESSRPIVVDVRILSEQADRQRHRIQDICEGVHY
jgi:hypothetical protein